MRERLDRKPFDYQVYRDNMFWSEHVVRLQHIASVITGSGAETIIDPAAGNGSLESLVCGIQPGVWGVVGDISVPNVEYMRTVLPGWTVVQGDIMGTLKSSGLFDVVVLSEILEHIDDPDAVLREAKEHATALIASSPSMRPGQTDPNPEHVWQFDAAGYREMVEQAGWSVSGQTILQFPTLYDFQVVVAR